MRLFYRPGKAVLGDVIPFYDEGQFKPFYLKNTRGHKDQGESGWHMLTTRDHIRFEEIPTHIEGGTGSVIKVDGTYHMFYCTFKDSPRRQYIQHAVSGDLKEWKTLEDETLPADNRIYHESEWRDPFVFWNEEKKQWWMLTASTHMGPTARRACVGLGTSEDLHSWQYQEPFYSPTETPGACECPDLFQMGDWYYLVYANYCDKFRTIYRMSQSLNGPWIAPKDEGLDSCAFYAAKTGSDGQNRYLYGWNPTKELDKKMIEPANKISRDCHSWDWGGSLVVHRLGQREDGTLTVGPEEHVDAFLQTPLEPEVTPVLGDCRAEGGRVEIRSDCGFSGALLNRIPEVCKFQCSFTYEKDTRRFGLALQVDENYDTGYYLYLEPGRQRIEYVSGIRFWGEDGEGGKMFPYAVEMERPFRMEAGKTYTLKVFIEDSVLVVYLNDEVAMNARMYDYQDRRFGLFAIDGAVRFDDIAIYTD